MKTTVTTIAPVLLPFLFAFAQNGAVSSYVRAPLERSSLRASNNPGQEIPRQRETNISQGLDTATQASTASKSVFAVPPRLASWLENAVTKISTYQLVADGWKGEGTLAPAAKTLEDAKELISQFATEMPTIASPSISADDDGSIYLYWQNENMIATVSVHGDGTYAFYAEGYDDPVRSDSEEVGIPLPAALIATMAGAPILTQIAA